MVNKFNLIQQKSMKMIEELKMNLLKTKQEADHKINELSKRNKGLLDVNQEQSLKIDSLQGQVKKLKETLQLLYLDFKKRDKEKMETNNNPSTSHPPINSNNQELLPLSFSNESQDNRISKKFQSNLSSKKEDEILEETLDILKSLTEDEPPFELPNKQENKARGHLIDQNHIESPKKENIEISSNFDKKKKFPPKKFEFFSSDPSTSNSRKYSLPPPISNNNEFKDDDLNKKKNAGLDLCPTCGKKLDHFEKIKGIFFFFYIFFFYITEKSFGAKQKRIFNFREPRYNKRNK